jgi:competence protein ComEA
MTLKTACYFICSLALMSAAGLTSAAELTAAKAPAAVAADAKALDLNAATFQELDALNGVGPVLAQKILDYRQKNGPFRKVEDLLAISGIGPLNLEHIRTQVKVTQVK